VGVGRVVAEGGMKGAWERRRDNIRNNKDVEEGKFCDILCIHGDQ
jgi:translation initiation factor 2D